MQEQRLGYSGQGGITCGAIEKASKFLKASDERVLINFRNKNALIATFRHKNGVFDFYEKYHDIS